MNNHHQNSLELLLRGVYRREFGNLKKKSPKRIQKVAQEVVRIFLGLIDDYWQKNHLAISKIAFTQAWGEYLLAINEYWQVQLKNRWDKNQVGKFLATAPNLPKPLEEHQKQAYLMARALSLSAFVALRQGRFSKEQITAIIDELLTSAREQFLQALRELEGNEQPDI
jgi:hypothetical protein